MDILPEMSRYLREITNRMGITGALGNELTSAVIRGAF